MCPNAPIHLERLFFFGQMNLKSEPNTQDGFGAQMHEKYPMCNVKDTAVSFMFQDQKSKEIQNLTVPAH